MKYLGIDFGLRRTGLAISEGELASPFKTLEVKGYKDALKQVVDVISKGGFTKIVIGLPGGKMGQIILGFIKALKKSGLDVLGVDETLSSQKALQQIIEQGIPQKKRHVNDKMAAAIILQDYLDSQ